MNAHKGYSDQELVRLLRHGNRDAFVELYERYWFMLYGSGFKILNNKEAVKDIVQDVFVWIWENRSTLHITYVKAYLKAALRFKIANYIRSGTIRDHFFDQFTHLSLHKDAPSSEEMIELKELRQVVHDSILQLPEKCREVYRLSREEGLNNRQIADRLGISIKTVENQMTIALKRLRSRLGFRLAYTLVFLCFLF